MTVAQRLYLLIFCAIVGLFGLTGLGLVQIEKVYLAANYANINTVPSILTLDSAFKALAMIRVQTLHQLATNDRVKKDAIGQRIDAGHAAVIEALNKYEKEDISDYKDTALLAAERRALAAYDILRAKALALSNEGKAEEARESMLLNQAVVDRLVDAFEEHRQYNAELGQQGAEVAIKTLKSSNTETITIALLVIASITCVGLMLVRKIVNALNKAVEIAKTVAAGDLTARIDVTAKDETGQLMQALKDMNDSLANIVSQVRNGTESIAAGSSQIASGNLDLSTRTEQQASSLEETASSMEEMTSTVKQNADNARQANQMAISASEVALKGGAVVLQVVDTMESISASSKKIVDIIAVIDGIAFQTNILALNAAVEAARAGEQGRGFAVVASEVRNLAQRSAAAAKEIKTLIGDSVEKVDIGSKLVDQAGSSMHAIVESIKNVTDIMGKITAASQEQSSGIEQINQAITQMDQVTQQNAALVEEAAAAAGSLQDQARSLAEVVSIFKINATNPSTIAPEQTHRLYPTRGATTKRLCRAL